MPPTTDVFQRPFFGAPTILALDARPMSFRRTADGRLISSAIRPSAAFAANYQARLLRLVDEMANSVRYWIAAAYRQQDDRIAALSGLAEDARPGTVLLEVIRRLRRRWLKKFDDASLDLARYFAAHVHQRSSTELKKILKRAGMAVEFKVSRTVRDALGAIVYQNVALIRSIPEQYLAQIEGSVMRSVVAGRDLASLTQDLQQQHGVTRRRAEFIALDQNNKATAYINRIQNVEVGITRGIWRHSHAGKEPRPTHVANDGNEFDLVEGWLDPAIGRRILPGTEPGCRCFWSPILPR